MTQGFKPPFSRIPIDDKQPNRLQRVGRRIKDRLKLTWVGWFYICARRTISGSALMVLFVLAFMLGTQGLVDYLSLRQYRSWNELPCETGSVTKIRVRTTGKGNSALTLVRAGVAHDFRGGALNYMTSELLQSLKGKEIRICYQPHLYILFPPHMRHDVSFVLSMDGAHSYYSPERTFDDALSIREKTIRFFWVWINLPILLFLLVRHGRDAWRQRRLHVARLARIAARARQPDVIVQ